MKNSKVCPKCNSNEVLRVDGYTGAYGAGNNIRIGASIFQAVNVNRYICCNCGYSEEWIDQEDLPPVIEKYSKEKNEEKIENAEK